jgi:DNA-binding response OmpR family regulator
MAETRLLVVEDEEHLARGIRFNLELDGYVVEVLADGKQALGRLAEPPPCDLVILDVMLPGLDGFAVARKLRAAGNFVPILMLTAKSLPEDVVNGLEAGADDYLAKPFELEVFLARVRGLLRRRDWTRNGASREAPLELGPAEIDFEAFEIRREGVVHRLTLLEAALLRLLLQNPGRVVGKGEILEKVWNLAPDTETRAVDNFIVRLRRYVEDDPKEPKRIVTVRGAGWKLVPD